MVQAIFKDTIYGREHKVELSEEKQLFIVRIQTYIFGGADIIKQEGFTTEKEIFDNYNNVDGVFIISKSINEIKVGFGSGAMLGGLDKKCTFKPVSQEIYDAVGLLTKRYKDIEKIGDKHNFLTGDSNQEMMDKARDMKYELKSQLRELTGWF